MLDDSGNPAQEDRVLLAAVLDTKKPSSSLNGTVLLWTIPGLRPP